MYKFQIKGVKNTHEYESLIKVFLLPSEFEITQEEASVVFQFKGEKNLLKREIYLELAKLTGKRPKWGILTGIRPVKLTGELLAELGSEDAVRTHLREYYLASPEKIDLLLELFNYQMQSLGKPAVNACGVYIGIPFCPTRCLYCSFTSNQAEDEKIEQYLEALCKEIRFVGERMALNGLYAETIYVGGGTPTTLNAGQLERLLKEITWAFDLSKTIEITVEAGRPDTIDAEKLKILQRFHVNRISINPQTMQNRTLKLIGRNHSSDSIREAFRLAKKSGIPIVNADVIAGLPEESLDDFKDTLQQVIACGADNITVHTLAVKRSSKLKDIDADFHYKQELITEDMVDYARSRLRQEGYRPYYLYKQKHTAGNTENIGYCKEDTIGIYNIRIMEEGQNIIALGAGGITKAFYHAENRLERVPNVSNYEIYIDRIDEMLQRKKDHLFRR